MMSVYIKRIQKIVPDFTTIWWWRVVKLKINLDPKVNLEKDDIVIAVDSTSIKVTNSGEWILDKWKNKRKRKGFIKIHVAINIKTKKIVSKNSVKKILADGGYDSK